MSCSIRTWPHALDAAKTQVVTSCCIPCLSRWLVLTGYWNSERRVAPCISAIVQSDSGAPDESKQADRPAELDGSVLGASCTWLDPMDVDGRLHHRRK